MTYDVIATGSKGNAVILNESILIDCGVSFAKLGNYQKTIKMVLLTHIHSDHFNKTCIKMLHDKRPTVRFVCCSWLVADLVELGISKTNIDVLEVGTLYNFGICKVMPVLLYHNVDQCGYRVFINDKKLIYATDTNKLDGIEAKDYDYYFIEANYVTDEVQQRIEEKKARGEFIYEYDAILNHLSKEKCDEFILKNAGENSQFIYLHQHIEREVKNMDNVQALDVYTDSKGNEHVIDEMANRMVYFTVLKYGTVDLAGKGYQKLVDRFNVMMKEINIMDLIAEKKEEE